MVQRSDHFRNRIELPLVLFVLLLQELVNTKEVRRFEVDVDQMSLGFQLFGHRRQCDELGRHPITLS